ncbi:MAG: hypothetical protein PHG23_02590 [Candidatus Pacebacteria bacterium]|nr:hypothetical protein [Candidatus Paceibacterota bacterium]
MLKKLIILFAVMAMLSAGCASNTCKSATGTIVQKKIIGIVEKVEHDTFLADEYEVTLTDGGILTFITGGAYTDYILVQNWSEIEFLQPGGQYEWLLEKDVSCGRINRPWTLVNTTKIK